MTAASSPRLAAEAISVDLGGRSILRRVSFAVAPGEILGIFGPSGAGKSTLFRVLAGELRPGGGVVRLDASDVTRRPLWQRARLGLGYVPQTSSVLFDLTVAENLAVFDELVGAPRAEAIARALGLGERFSVRASALSGGERRRLELSRALSARPRVLLCDEPFSAMDPKGATLIAGALAALAEEGASVVLADHNLPQALPLCGRAALLLEGEIAVLGSGRAFSEHDLVRSHYIVG